MDFVRTSETRKMLFLYRETESRFYNDIIYQCDYNLVHLLMQSLLLLN